MPDSLGPGSIVGYCTNVHAGATLAEARANLERHAVDVKAAFSPDAPMGVGWWLSAESAAAVGDHASVEELKSWFERLGLTPFTLNAFPYGDFHEKTVKHRVYTPDWGDPRRLDYTSRLARLLAGLADGPCERSISTLPLGWPGAPNPVVELESAAANLVALTERLRALEDDTGVLVHVDIEPEPGCLLDRSEHVVELFNQRLDPAAAMRGVTPETVRRYLRVCHDVCHAAVMFEPQRDAIAAFRDAGIAVGKVQVSSGLRVPFDDLSPSERAEAVVQLRAFAEDRYLHQTVVGTADGEAAFFEDLPIALDAIDLADGPRGEWRVHFHVPLFLERFGLIETTQPEIGACLNAIVPDDGVRHYEVETYAWGVLPEDLRAGHLAEGIARELRWFSDLAESGQGR